MSFIFCYFLVSLIILVGHIIEFEDLIKYSTKHNPHTEAAQLLLNHPVRTIAISTLLWLPLLVYLMLIKLVKK